ncbi:MAG: hypothetical protein HYT75_00215 [Deltaproteobacteria bacterium]|nr:hypothetical protein [Deltaproteobacteria bacterium]MBI2342267.1 hypothetical protein [Deltaproteobacteria bacterium]
MAPPKVGDRNGFFQFPDVPDWSDVSGKFDGVGYRTVSAPIYGKASFYGKFDGYGLKDNHTVCGPMAVPDGRPFHPFKLYIATRNLIGKTLKVTLVDAAGKPILDNSEKEIFVIAEGTDYGPHEKTGRTFDLSYGIAEYFSEKAGKKIVSYRACKDGSKYPINGFIQDGKISNSEVHVKVEEVSVEAGGIQELRAYTFHHKVVNPNQAGVIPSCMNTVERNGDVWVAPSAGDMFAVGLDPEVDLSQYSAGLNCNNGGCFAQLSYKFCVCTEGLSKEEKRAATSFRKEVSLGTRLGMIRVLGMQPDWLHPTEFEDESGEKCYGTEIYQLTLSQAIYLSKWLQNAGVSLLDISLRISEPLMTEQSQTEQ